ncbi:MAG: sugar phosphate isomerase/epimerase [Candidatus Margulisbacteria bacterium]|jgi:sugar phosphate isomerase/epimerase|nr:sugar phosphate isomerase/epimerase [Candidatus Margulisiibacteriota bacterium]
MEKLRLGIVQGRLIQAPAGQLQWFPQDQWEEEFSLAAALGIDYIELIAERKRNPRNPLWTDEGIAQIKNLVKRNGLTLPAFCNDYVVDNPLPDNKEVLEQTLKLLERGALLGCEKYILPLFEHSELNIDNADKYVAPLRAIADKAASSGISVCLETILNGTELIKVLERIDHPALSVVFDTGNRAAFGHDLPGDIKRLGNRISHVHIKDKNAANENVILGTGLVDFLKVFAALAEIKYDGLYTFETQRGKDPLRTAKYNIALVQYFHAEAFSR